MRRFSKAPATLRHGNVLRSVSLATKELTEPIATMAALPTSPNPKARISGRRFQFGSADPAAVAPEPVDVAVDGATREFERGAVVGAAL